MNRRVALLLCLLIASSAAHLWQARTARGLRARVAELEAEASRRDERVRQLAEQARARRDPPRAAPTPSVAARPFIPDEPEAIAASVTDEAGRLDPRAVAELRREEVRQILLNAVLEVVAEAAAEEGWDPEVAADVMAVFEGTAERMGEVRAQVVDGQLSVAEGRAQMLELRDKAGLKLEKVLGPADTERLRDHMFDHVQASVEERRAARPRE